MTEITSSWTSSDCFSLSWTGELVEGDRDAMSSEGKKVKQRRGFALNSFVEEIFPGNKGLPLALNQLN